MRLPVRPADRRTARAADWQDPDWERSRARCIADACYERTFGRLLFERMKPVTGSARIIKLNGLARSDQEDPEKRRLRSRCYEPQCEDFALAYRGGKPRRGMKGPLFQSNPSHRPECESATRVPCDCAVFSGGHRRC